MVGYLKKRGQVTIFVILAILLVAIVLSIFYFIPSIRTTTTFNEQNPNLFLQSCLEEPLEEIISTISTQGGVYQSDFCYPYEDQCLEYLCYNDETFNPTCTVLQPMLMTSIENEIKTQIEDDFNICFQELIEKYQGKGYDVETKSGNLIIQIFPEKVRLTSNNELILSKRESSKFTSFSVFSNTNLYEFVKISNDIILWETSFGDSPLENLMYKYQNYNIEKHRQTGDTKIYKIESLEKGDKFQFASRSLIYPGGVA